MCRAKVTSWTTELKMQTLTDEFWPTRKPTIYGIGLLVDKQNKYVLGASQ